MPIQFRCNRCNKRVQAPDTAAGKKAKCPACEKVIDVPRQESDDDLLADFDEFVARQSLEAARATVRQVPRAGGSAAHHPLQVNVQTSPVVPRSRNPSSCPNCATAFSPGARWCSICRSNVVNPGSGRLASPGKWLAAQLFDLLVWTVAFSLSLLLLFLLLGTGGTPPIEEGINMVTLLALILALFPIGVYLVWILVSYSRATTPGKKLLGMRVVKEDGRNAGFITMIIRDSIGKLISGWIFWLGFAWILIDPDNQGWHDKLMRTYVVE